MPLKPGSLVLPVHRAARRGDVQMLHLLLEEVPVQAQPDFLNTQTDYGYTALHWSTVYNQADAARILIEKGCDTSILNSRGKTAWDLVQVGSDVTTVFESFTASHPQLREESLQRQLRPKVDDTFRDDIQLDENRLVVWDVSTEGFDRWKLVGQGGFGKVYLVKDVSPAVIVNGRSFQNFAVKVPNTGTDVGATMSINKQKKTTLSPASVGVTELQGEVELLARIQHENVVQFLGMVRGPAPDSEGAKTWMICLEYCESDLEKRIYGECEPESKVKGIQDTQLSYAEVVEFALQIARGMEYVHSQRDLKGRNMMHLDLKPENVLLANAGTQADPHWICKVADFGMDGDETESSDGAVTLVRTASPSVKATTSGDWTGTPEYMSPEATGQLKPTLKIEQAADVFSFAIVLWEMLAWHRVRLGFGDATLQTVWVTEDGEELRGENGMPGTTPEDGVPEGAYQREDMRSVTVWMMKGARPKAEGQSQWPTGLVLLIQACWTHMPGERLTFPQVVRVLQTMQDSTDGSLWQRENVNAPTPSTQTTARAWLNTLGYLTDAQINEAVAYTQEEGEPRALVEMDAEDFDEMVEEMKVSTAFHILYDVYQPRL